MKTPLAWIGKILFIVLILGLGGFYFWSSFQTDKTPGNVMEEARYDSVFVELRMIAKYVEYSGDSLNGLALTAQVWKRYGIDQADFYKAQAYYETNAKAQGSRLGRLADSLSALELRLNKAE